MGTEAARRFVVFFLFHVDWFVVPFVFCSHLVICFVISTILAAESPKSMSYWSLELPKVLMTTLQAQLSCSFGYLHLKVVTNLIWILVACDCRLLVCQMALGEYSFHERIDLESIQTLAFSINKKKENYECNKNIEAILHSHTAAR